MNHYKAISGELETLRGEGSMGSRNGTVMATDIQAFNIPASLLIVALKYAMRSAWSEEDRQEIKSSVLKIYDEIIVPLDVPAVGGAAERAIEKVGRGILAAALDYALG